MPAKTLHELFRASVRRVPDRVALEVDRRVLSYAQLDAAADRLAGQLLRAHGAPPARVGLLASRTLLAYAGYLAILRLGGAVVPLSPSVPAERTGQIAAAAGLDAVLVAEGTGPAPSGPTVLAVDDAALLEPSPAERVDLPPAADDLAYVLFTSGSTGRPKGVPIRHANLRRFLAYNIDRYGIRPGCRLSQTFDLTFDPSVFDLFCGWGAGATVVVPTTQEILDPVSFVTGRAITHWYSVPSVISMASMLGSLPPGSLPKLRWSLFAGEQLTLDQARTWAAAAPASTVENVYGPTELTVTVAAYRLPADQAAWPVTSNGTVPIGTVYPHLEHLLLVAAGDPAGAGELCVRGPQRFGGYLDPRENAGRFYRSPGTTGLARVDELDWYRTGDHVTVEGGQLVHRGRVDQQVKIRGHRVELAEIEAALRAIHGVAEAVVLCRSAATGGTEMVALYRGQQRAGKDLAATLRRKLPGYMVPDRYVRLDRMPVNAHGKVDRQRLASLHGGG